MTRGKFAASLVVVLLGAMITGSPCQGGVNVGDIAPNWTLNIFGTTTPMSLTNSAGKVLLMDFFAYNCGPCMTASSELEPYIQDYYAGLGGNPAKVPVQLISLANNYLSGSNYTNGTANYITTYHLNPNYVLNDLAQTVFNPYKQSGGIPQFVIVNGALGARNNVTGNSIRQWEVIGIQVGYGSGLYQSFRTTINQVDKPRWQGNLSGNWDIGIASVPSQGTKNWRFVGTTNTLAYYQGDEVLFDDNATGTTTVNLTTTVTPVKITVDNSAKDYTFSGSGKISGATGITKSGSRLLKILTNNNYTGATTIAGGTLEVASGGAINSISPITVGSSLAGGSALKISGGSVSTSAYSGNSLAVGGTASQPGTVNITAGTLATTGSTATVVVGDNAPGTWTQSGGTANVAGNLWFGKNSTGSAMMTLSNNAALTLGSAATEVVFGSKAAATMTIQDTATATVPTLSFGSSGTANTNSRTVNLNGGTLAVKKIRLAGGSTGTFNFNGGVLQSRVSDTNFMSGLPNAMIKEGGARIDTNGNNITIGQALQHGGLMPTDGGLMKSGEGKLILTGALTYTGNTTVLAGTLEVGPLTQSANVTVNGTLNATSITTNILTISSLNPGSWERYSLPMNLNFSANAVPEPGTIVLWATAMVVVIGWGLKKRRNSAC